MAQQVSIDNLSDSEQFVVFEHVIEYISDVATLASLTLVSKQARSAVYRSNGLRVLTFTFRDTNFYFPDLNEVNTSRINRNQNLKDGMRWLWTVGKRLKTVQIINGSSIINVWRFYDAVFPLLNSLVATEKRRIETIEISGMPCDWAVDLVCENRNTLRNLRVELQDQQDVSILRSLSSELPKSQSFWSAVQQCKRLQSLDLLVMDPEFIPTEFWNVLCETPLKHLSLHGVLNNSEVLQKFIEVLSCDTLRFNLQSLTLYYCNNAFRLLFDKLTAEITDPRLPAAFMIVKKLTFNFVKFCSVQNLINWLAFMTFFPTVNKIKDNSACYRMRIDTTNLSQNVVNFCKTYLEVTQSRSHETKIEIPDEHKSIIYPLGLRAVVANAATLPDDQDWCVSHGVQIETETRDEKVERVTLSKDTLKLVFDLK